MKLCFGWAALFLPAALFAQPQIGGGQCSSSTLSGNYSLTISGRELGSISSPVGLQLVFENILQGVGTANFDGLSKVTFTLTNNTNKAIETPQTWTGTYTMQSNCVGALSLTGSETASFTLGSYSQGRDFFVDGYDGIYSLLGSGSALPASCSASLLNGIYSFNGSAFMLTGGGGVGPVADLSGLITFDGTSAITTNWYLANTVNGSQNDTSTGTYTVNADCTAAATVTDASGAAYSLQFVITAAKGTNFLIDAASSGMMFVGSGRTL